MVQRFGVRNLTGLFALDGEKLKVEYYPMIGPYAYEPIASFTCKIARRTVILFWKIRTCYDPIVEAAYIWAAVCKIPVRYTWQL